MSDLGRPITWRIVLQTCSGKLYIHRLEMDSNDTSVASMQKLQIRYQSLKYSSTYKFWDRVILFWKPVIETAILSVICKPSSRKV
jgi:hypothetical protein